MAVPSARKHTAVIYGLISLVKRIRSNFLKKLCSCVDGVYKIIWFYHLS